MSPTAPFLAPERDDSYTPGRPKSTGASIQSIVPGVAFVSQATRSFILDLDHYGPCYVTSPLLVDQLTCEVTTGASGNLRMGIYRANKDWQPVNGPLADSGNIAITVAVKTYTPGTPLYLRPGRYLTVVALDTTSTLRIYRGSVLGSISTGLGNMLAGLSPARTYAAFPTPGTGWGNVDATFGTTPHDHAVWLRVSAP